MKTQRRRPRGTTNYSLTVDTQKEVLLVCKKLLPFSFKKEWDLLTVIAYLEDRITGEEALGRLNKSTESGRREGLIRNMSMPFSKSEGIEIAAQVGWRRSSAKRARLTERQVELLRDLRKKSGKTYAELAHLFKVSSDVVRTALGKKRHPV